MIFLNIEIIFATPLFVILNCFKLPFENQNDNFCTNNNGHTCTIACPGLGHWWVKSVVLENNNQIILDIKQIFTIYLSWVSG